MYILHIEYSSVICFSVECIGHIQRYFSYIYLPRHVWSHIFSAIHQVCKNARIFQIVLEDRVENEKKRQTLVLKYMTEMRDSFFLLEVLEVHPGCRTSRRQIIQASSSCSSSRQAVWSPRSTRPSRRCDWLLPSSKSALNIPASIK